MCGICGFTGGTLIGSERWPVLDRMTATLLHRGPDDRGFFLSNALESAPAEGAEFLTTTCRRSVALGMQRLAVIDPAGGRQPVRDEAGTLFGVFNGEIYNFQTLRVELEAAGHRFRSRTDSEVIVHGYEEWGTEVFDHLDGMFAIALYDTRSDILLLARDRIGVKPLFTYDDGSLFAFGSEIKALLAHPGVRCGPNYAALDAFLQLRFLPWDETAFAGVRKVPPGHYLIHDGAEPRLVCYWQPDPERRFTGSYGEARERVGELVAEAVKKRLIADVPLGVFLSGGIDSSIIVALMTRLSSRVASFTIGFEESSYSEVEYARMVARHCGTEHQERIVRPDNLPAVFDAVTRAVDEPCGSPGALAEYFVSRAARPDVTVALSGLGADEGFAGYERYWIGLVHGKLRFLPPGLRRVLVRLSERLLPASHEKKGLGTRVGRMLGALDEDPLRSFVQTFRILDPARGELMTAEFRARVGRTIEPPVDRILARYAALPRDDLLRAYAFIDLGTNLLDCYTMVNDRMSMAHSLEIRAPFLDYRLLEFACSLPTRYKLKGLTTKRILRDLYRDQLPAAILRRGKHGFEIPAALWLKTGLRDLARDLLTSERTRSRGLVDVERAALLLEEHFAECANHMRIIWVLMGLEAWLRCYGEGS